MPPSLNDPKVFWDQASNRLHVGYLDRQMIAQLDAAMRSGEVIEARTPAFVLQAVVVDVRIGLRRSDCQAQMTVVSMGEERRPTAATWAGAGW